MARLKPELRLSGIRKRFGATLALDGVDLEAHGGEVHAVLGENGAGKSTLMKILAGAEVPDAGEMWLGLKPYAPMGPFDARRQGIAMIYQELSLCPSLTVAENLALGLEEPGPLLSRSRMRARARDALARIGRADLPLDLPTRKLPLALQQLVEIARAAASGARVIVFDEPTSSLARDDVQGLFRLIAGLKADGLVVLYISHFLEEVRAIADRFTVLRDGRTVDAGKVPPGGEAEGRALEGRWISKMVGREIGDLYPRPGAVTAGAPLALELHGAQGDLLVAKGEVVGIAGLVGSGRTELLRALQGLDAKPEGLSVSLSGKGASGETCARRWREGMGLVSESRKEEGLALGLSIAENLVLPKPPRASRRVREARQWVERLGVRCREVTQKVGELSGGNQQKVAIARLLYAGVEILLLDEPTRGIDVGSKAEIYAWVGDLAAQGKAVVIVSSYLPELLGICHRIAVMRRGRLGEARPTSEWTEEALLAEAVG